MVKTPAFEAGKAGSWPAAPTIVQPMKGDKLPAKYSLCSCRYCKQKGPREKRTIIKKLRRFWNKLFPIDKPE